MSTPCVRTALRILHLWEYLYGCQLLREILHQSTKLSDIWLLEKLLFFLCASLREVQLPVEPFEYLSKIVLMQPWNVSFGFQQNVTCVALVTKLQIPGKGGGSKFVAYL